MDIKIKDTQINKLVDAKIIVAEYKDMPLKTNKWNFNWRKLYKENGFFYRVVRKSTPDITEGIMKLEILNNEMLYMSNVELAPYNYGSEGQYDYVAGSLIAYGCLLSFTYGKGNYNGFLIFDSKTRLIDFYKEKYGAFLAYGQRMFILPENGKKLIKKYLEID